MPVDGEDAAGRVRRRRQEDRVRADAVAVHRGGRLQVIHEQQAQLGDHVHQAELLADLEADREVVRELGREEQLGVALDGAA